MRDHGLAQTFLANAYGFLGRDLNCLATSLDLGLKSFLLHRGYPDAWNASFIRRDLRLALDLATDEGFVGVSPAMAMLIDAFSPVYSELHIHRHLEAAQPALVSIAGEATYAMLEDIRVAIGG